MPTPIESIARRGRWFQYGLRTALLVMFVSACGGAWISNHVSRCRREQDAIARLMTPRDGRSFAFLYASPFAAADVPGEMDVFFEGGPRWLTRWLGVDMFRVAISLNCYAAGNSFSYGADENGTIQISRTYPSGIQDSEMPLVARFRHLRHLSLEAQGITDEGLAFLAKLRDLRSLNLSQTAITDTGVVALAQLTGLKALDLSRTDVSDRSLSILARFHNLESLNLVLTRMTPDGVAKLRAAIPDCKIEF